MNLSPQQLHYFKRELISQELEQETDSLKKTARLSSLIQPTPDIDDCYPFLQYISKHFILDFPLLKQNGHEKDFWTKLESLLNEYSQLKLANAYVPKSTQDSQSRILWYKVQKLLIISLSASIKTVQGKEESINLLSVAGGQPENQAKEEEENELNKTINMSRLELEDDYLESTGINGLLLNVITMRDLLEKGTFNTHSHPGFVIETKMILFNDEGQQQDPVPIFVARRHGQFGQLRKDLKAMYPTLELPTAPSKAKTDTGNLKRAKDCIMLRHFLRRLSAVPEVAASDIFREFLTTDTIELTEEEKKDAHERAVQDQKRAHEERVFRKQVDEKIVELDGLLGLLKTTIMKPNGLLEIFDIIKKTDKIDQLPIELRKAIEWGRINFAFVLHTQFFTSDSSVENITNLKRTNALIPYRTMANILKLSNPFTMVKGVLDLFLAQPLGSNSLFQRIVLSNMNEQTKELQKDIEAIELYINDASLCLKIANAIKVEIPNDVTMTNNFVQDTLELLRNEAIEPALTSAQIQKVANTKHDVTSRELVENLYKLWILYARKQEQEVLMALVFQGVTGDIIKDLFAIFYEPLAKVYKAANIGDTIHHVSDFVKDLIGVVDGLDDGNHTENSAQQFIDLVQRHEGEFYTFVHNVHANDQSKLFDDLLGYVDRMFNFVSTGIPQRIDMEQVTTEAGVSAAEYPTLIKEIDALCAYHCERKQRHLDRKRQKLMSANSDLLTGGEQEMYDFFPNNKEVMGVLNDMSEFDDDDEDDEEFDSTSSSNNMVAHEMTLQVPTLTLIPRIVPTFVKHVKAAMDSNI